MGGIQVGRSRGGGGRLEEHTKEAKKLFGGIVNGLSFLELGSWKVLYGVQETVVFGTYKTDMKCAGDSLEGHIFHEHTLPSYVLTNQNGTGPFCVRGPEASLCGHPQALGRSDSFSVREFQA